jgi:hypothetical protein
LRRYNKGGDEEQFGQCYFNSSIFLGWKVDCDDSEQRIPFLEMKSERIGVETCFFLKIQEYSVPPPIIQTVISIMNFLKKVPRGKPASISPYWCHIKSHIK